MLVEPTVRRPPTWLPLLLAWAAAQCGVAMAKVCPRRNCLPPDSTQNPPICFTQTLATLSRPAAQFFATCSSKSPSCEVCTTDPPCESRCQAQPTAKRPLGAECYFDQQCNGPFAKCLQRVCKRALYTFQACDSSSPNDACILGQKSCFRGRCQGVASGQPCSAHPEGRDIDCNPGWYCFLGVCTPQLPSGHSCTGQHPSECVRGCRCNLALRVPRCSQEFTLDLGEVSSEPRLCKSFQVDPRVKQCGLEPPLVIRDGRPVVSAKDCSEDAACPRADESLGVCACKSWWEGDGLSGYCELEVADPGRPAYKRFWEASVRLCHHDWSSDRCAEEIGMQGILAQINKEAHLKASDPTQVKDCAKDVLISEFADMGRSPSKLQLPCLAMSMSLALHMLLFLPTLGL